MKKKLSLVLATLMLLGPGWQAAAASLLQAATRIRWWCISAISSTP